jgi:hypothetical protein
MMNVLPPSPRPPSTGSRRNARAGLLWLLLAVSMAAVTVLLVVAAAIYARDGLGVAVFMSLLMGGLDAFAFLRARTRFRAAQLHLTGLELVAVVQGATAAVTHEGTRRVVPLSRQARDLVPMQDVEDGYLALATPDLARVHLVAREEIDLKPLAPAPALTAQDPGRPVREVVDADQVRELARSFRLVGLGLPKLMAGAGVLLLIQSVAKGFDRPPWLAGSILAAAGLLLLKELRLARRRERLAEVGVVVRACALRIVPGWKSVKVTLKFQFNSRSIQGTILVPTPWAPREHAPGTETDGGMSSVDVILDPDRPTVWIPLCDLAFD